MADGGQKEFLYILLNGLPDLDSTQPWQNTVKLAKPHHYKSNVKRRGDRRAHQLINSKKLQKSHLIIIIQINSE